MPRTVLPGLTQAKKAAKSAKRNAPMIFMIIVVLLSAVAGVIYFHGIDIANAPEKTGFDDSWFLRNNQSQKPPNLLDLLNPKKPEKKYEIPYNLTGILFVVDGDASFWAWRYKVLDHYVMDYGWDRRNDTYQAYLGETRGSVSFNVHKEFINITDVKTLDLVSLWQPSNGIEATRFEVQTNSSVTVMTAPEKGKDNEELRITLYASEPAIVNLTYKVYGVPLDEEEIAARSSIVKDTVDYAKVIESLQYYTEIPDGYFDKYPQVKRVFDSLNASIDSGSNTIYEAVAIATSLLRSNFTILPTGDMPEGDPVAAFVNNGGGTIPTFVYTVALFLRYIGIPTRVVFGIMGGRYNSTLDKTFLEMHFLRFWIEVYDRGNGWIPFNVDPFAGDLENLVEVTFRVFLYILTSDPGTIGNYKATYLDVNFTLYLEIRGIGVTSLSGNVSFYDLNITVDGEPYLIGEVPLEVYDNQTLVAILETNYQIIYDSLGETPLYGIHVIQAKVWGLTILEKLVLVRRSSIG